MDATRTNSDTAVPAPLAMSLISRLLIAITLVLLGSSAWAKPAAGSAPLQGGWVVLTVLAVLVAGLWLQSMRRRQF